ncbi:hypothetical protein ACLPFM_00825 [Providencia stuartii]|uniref:hypothetical protein n=1 Tax=Providencia stuartii TaxID=588 RepID=UPI002AB33CA2|nr:hypothetical protein [Providencia stuartii]
MSMFLQQMAVSGGAVQSQNTWQSSGDSFGDGASSDTSHSLIADIRLEITSILTKVMLKMHYSTRWLMLLVWIKGYLLH